MHQFEKDHDPGTDREDWEEGIFRCEEIENNHDKDEEADHENSGKQGVQRDLCKGEDQSAESKKETVSKCAQKERRIRQDSHKVIMKLNHRGGKLYGTIQK